MIIRITRPNISKEEREQREEKLKQALRTYCSEISGRR